MKVFKIVAPGGDSAYWAGGDPAMTGRTRRQLAEYGWAIGTRHRGIKRCTEAGRRSARGEGARRNHTGRAPRAFLGLEYHVSSTGISRAEAEAAIIRDAVRSYLAHPSTRLPTA